jgi:hypothetical protein
MVFCIELGTLERRPVGQNRRMHQTACVAGLSLCGVAAKYWESIGSENGTSYSSSLGRSQHLGDEGGGGLAGAVQ